MKSKGQINLNSFRPFLKFGITTFFVFAGALNALALELKFDVLYQGDTIGVLDVSKQVTEGEIRFNYSLDITSTVFFKTVRIQYTMDAKYQKTELRYYHLLYKINGKVNEEVTLTWATDHYNIVSLKKKDKDRHDEVINFTTVLLFFSEPLKRTRVWGELNCRYQALVRQTDGGYAMDTGGGRNNVFYYKDNQLDRATFDTPVLDFEIFRERQ